MYSNEVMNVIYEELGIIESSNEEVEYLNEFTIGAIKKIKDLAGNLKDQSKKLKELKNSDLSEFSNAKDVEKYLDKSADAIYKSASDIEKNRTEYRGANIKIIIRMAIEMVAVCASAISLPVFIIVSLVSIIDSINYLCKSAKYSHANIDVNKDLNKLKNSLQNLQRNKNLKESDIKKIDKCIDKIEDASESL